MLQQSLVASSEASQAWVLAASAGAKAGVVAIDVNARFLLKVA
jgi:hypothetical protein